MPKIICIGFQKTGTTSLAAALSGLGINVGDVHGKVYNGVNWKAGDVDKQVLDITLAELEQLEAIQDSPCVFLHQELDAAFPGSKFILTIRNTDSWLESYRKFFKDKCNPFQRWMYKIDQFSGNEDHFRKVYNDKNAEIIDYFKDRPNDFLILDMAKGDGWLELVPFLGQDFLKPFPHVNKMGVLNAKRKKLQRRNVITRFFYVITIIVLLVIWAYQ